MRSNSRRENQNDSTAEPRQVGRAWFGQVGFRLSRRNDARLGNRAIGDGVVRRSLAEAISDASLAVAYRHTNITNAAARSVLSFADRQAAAEAGYDYVGLVGQAGYQLDRWFFCKALSVNDCENRAARANLWLQSADRFFCSELVAEAYRQAGIALTNGRSNQVSPNGLVELFSSGLLLYVGHLKT